MGLAFLVMIVFVASFTRSVAGFGMALIAMPLLTRMLGIRVAAPLVALIGVTSQTALLVRYRYAFNLPAVGRLAAASLFGVPLGVFALRRINERMVLILLGAVITGYALYALLELRLPELEHTGWAYGFGFVAGLLSGAYNVPGPPVIVYGSCCRWPPAEFKSNLQGFFLITTTMVVGVHALNHNLTRLVWQDYLIALPATGLGLWAGFSLDRYLDPIAFRKVIFGLLIVLGLWLIFEP